jgi:hypothetical protein
MNKQDIEIYIVTFPDRMARGGHGLPKASPGPAMPNPFMPCEQTTPEMALRVFMGWPVRRAGGLQPSSTRFDTPRRSPMRLVVESIQTFGNF